jgi:NADPH:quinone reductase-like Zn-dependent oxidoreductase
MSAAQKRVIVSRRGGPDVLHLHEEPVPEPQPGEVRVKVLAAGVAFADVLMREGLYPGTPPVSRRGEGRISGTMLARSGR